MMNPNPNNKGSEEGGVIQKKKRNHPGTPDPEAEVIALSPKTLMATNRFICEICNKGFQRDQNLQLHRRGHNLPWKLRQRSNKEPVRKKVYICPEKSCVHHDASRALGDLTGIKKHFSRKHGEKKWKCHKCSKKYAVQSDWKAHSKTCGTREYKCDCGTLFSRKDSFITHRAFCDALALETSSLLLPPSTTNLNFHTQQPPPLHFNHSPNLSLWLNHHQQHATSSHDNNSNLVGLYHHNASSSFALPDIVQMNNFTHNSHSANHLSLSSSSLPAIGKRPEIGPSSSSDNLASIYTSDGQSTTTDNNNNQLSPMSATALLQKAAQMGSTRSTTTPSIFSATFGVMTSSSSNNSNHNAHAGDFASTSSFSSFTHSSNTYDHLVMQTAAQNSTTDPAGNLKLPHHAGSNSASMEHNLTRDFLGVSGAGEGPAGLHQFLPQELAKFASSMGLTQFTTN
ncbi:zinc finger protein JACKDAW-like [Arachis stenosperma]|uniref:zinc finger protein JACKDAW-like n=1 Tax=Arachis stenosperma TaxID=217475 RepID=UPI0025AB9FBE|nr:zinc finger protein JACKDAW-like [Arachis stenosperma]